MATKPSEIIVIENGTAIGTENLHKADGKTEQENNFELSANFRTECAKFWPFRAIKIANWILFLLLAIGTFYVEKYNTNWSDAWANLPLMKRTRMITAMHLIFLVFISIAMLAGWITCCCCKSFLSIVEVSVMNICIWALSIPMLLINSLLYCLKSFAEYRWFVPRIKRYYNNATEEGLRELTELYKPKRHYDSDEQWQEEIHRWQNYMAERKFKIFLHFVIDPIIAILEVLTILTSIYLTIYLIKMMRRCKVWAPKAEDYKHRHPDCSPLEQQYSKLGVFKTVQWLAPALLFFTFLYSGIFHPQYVSCFSSSLSPWRCESTRIVSSELVYMFGLITILCFPQWLGFICKVNLRQKRDEKPNGLMCTFFWDVILCAFIALYFVLNLKSTLDNGETQAHHPHTFMKRAEKYEFLFYIAGIFIYGGSLAMNVWILWKNRRTVRWNPPKPKMPHLQLPVSIKVKFNVEVKRRDAPVPNNNKPKNDEDEKQMECLLTDEEETVKID